MTAKTSEAVDDRGHGAKQTDIPKSIRSDPLVLALVALTFTTGLIDAGTPVDRLYAMIALTAITMGLRNATVRRLSVPDLTTTVLTLTLTDLAADSPLAGGNNPRAVRRLLSVIVLFGGAAIGAFLLRYALALPFFVTAAGVLGTTAAYASIARSTKSRPNLIGALLVVAMTLGYTLTDRFLAKSEAMTKEICGVTDCDRS
jgi:uncharacterized membrane protein YoaK (UPF0700 family)